MKMWIDGRWEDAAVNEDVLSPYTNQPVGTVPVADLSDVERAIAAAGQGRARW